MNRLYIQPVKGGKTRNSKMDSNNVLAQVQAADPAEPENVRQALKDSYAQKGKLIVAKRKAWVIADVRSPTLNTLYRNFDRSAVNSWISTS